MSSVAHLTRRRRQRRQSDGPGPVFYGALLVVGLLFLALVVGIGGLFGMSTLAYWQVASLLPQEPQSMLLVSEPGQPTRLLDRDGQRILYEVTDPASSEIPWYTLDELPSAVRQATVASVDPVFFDRSDFSTAGLLDALQDAFIFGEMNIADPLLLALAQNVLVPLHDMPLDHPDRVHTDAILITELRRRFSREELLAWYLNTALYGNGAYGFEAAARLYLGKAAPGVTLGEAALLAGVPTHPSQNPFDQPEAAHARQLTTLDMMAAAAMIEPAELTSARTPIEITRALAPTAVVAPHYALAARRQAEMLLNDAGYDGARMVAGGGLAITTALDLDLQFQAECALRTQLIRLSGVDPSFVYATSTGDACRAAAYLPDLPPQDVGVAHQVENGAVVVIRPATGEVLSYVGSIDYWNEDIGGPIDSAARAYQPGSLLHPYIYLTALSQGYTPATMTLDVQQDFPLAADVYHASNPDHVYRGPLSLREALLTGAVPPAAQTMNWVGIDDTLRTAHSMGLNTLQDGPGTYDLTLVEGGGGATLADLTFSLGVLANTGHMMGTGLPDAQQQPGYRTVDPVLVLRIADEAGNVLWQYEPVQRDTLDPALAYLMNDMMGDRELRAQMLGPANPFDIGRPAAVSAGGASDSRDWWTVGYSPQISAGVWIGNVDREPTVHLTAATGPAPVWNAIMRYVHDRDGLPAAGWQQPPTVVEQAVCAVSGLLPTEYCPVVAELFAQGTQPNRQDTFYQMVEVNRENGRRATASTPRELVEQRVYFNYPAEAQAWATSQGIQGPPVDYDAIGPPPVFGPVAVLEPDPLAYVGGVVDVRGNATLPNFQYYQLTYGAGLNPPNWTQIGEQIYVPARGALLGQWDTNGLADGLYSLRLTGVTTDQEVQESVIQVTVDNAPPVVSISVPMPDEEVRVVVGNPIFDAGVTFSDNVAVTEVVYYLDGSPVYTAAQAPFAATISIDVLGGHSIWAEAFDAADNSSLSERVAFTVLRQTQ
ncbi:penicillin-binding protein [Chloroflexota bacterium]